MEGWTRQYRKRFDNPLWKKEVYCRGRAWDWLVEYACHTPIQIDFNGKIIDLKRGQLSYSVRFLGKRWKWSKSTVDRFLTRLKTGTGDGPMIETDTGTGQLIITICNYSIYQPITEGAGTASETATGTVIGTGSGQGRDKEEDLEDKKKKGSASSLRSDTGDRPLSEIIFGQGLKFLCKSGVPERQARSVLGKWRKNYGDEKLLAALGKAQREGALDPVAFCEGIFRHVNGKPEPKTASDHIRDELRTQGRREGCGGGGAVKRYGIPRRRQALYDSERRHIAIAKMRQHFLTRMAERAPEINAVRLFDELAIAISHRFDNLVWKICRCRLKRECWRFRADGQILYVVFSDRYLCPVTVMLPGQKVHRFRRKRPKILRDVA